MCSEIVCNKSTIKNVDRERIISQASEIRGLVAPVFTPLKADGTLNCDAIPGYLNYLVYNGIKNILLNGTTGEGMSLGVHERRQVTEAWVTAARPLGILVMVQVGGAALPDVLALAKHAQDIGANAILTLPELYFKPTNTKDLVTYVDLISKAAPNLSIYFYHFPIQSGVEVNIPEFVAAAKAKVPNFKGLKCNVGEGAEVLLRTDGVTVFLGNSFVLTPAFLGGIDSSIATLINLQPRLCADILSAVQSNDTERAKRLQRELNRFTDCITAEGAWVPAMKAAMQLVTSVAVGPVRVPLNDLGADKREKMRQRLVTNGFSVATTQS